MARTYSFSRLNEDGNCVYICNDCRKEVGINLYLLDPPYSLDLGVRQEIYPYRISLFFYSTTFSWWLDDERVYRVYCSCRCGETYRGPLYEEPYHILNN